MHTEQQRQQILQKAYEIWEAEGRPDGHDMEHWFKAELLIAKETGKSKTPAKKAPAKKASTAKKASPAKKPAAKKPAVKKTTAKTKS